MAIDTQLNQQLSENFSLLCNVIQQRKTGQLKADLSKLETILHKQIPEALKKNTPPDYYELYTDFQAEYEKFRDFILYDRLIGKNVVALGGGFSSGKSSFLNALNGEDALPFSIDPTTSVPTYIVHGEDYDVQGINIFDTKVTLQPHQLGDIAHGFGKILNEDNEVLVESTTLGHVLESIFLSTPMQSYQNIAFLDTPGYSKPDSEEYTSKTDADIARRQLNASNFILWFVQADAGTITEEDIKFIKGLHDTIPKLIVLTKADKKPQVELDKIREKIRSTLHLKDVRYVDVCTYSSVEPDEYDSQVICKYLADWNNHPYTTKFAHHFKTLFLRCRKFYEEELEQERIRLNHLNALSMAGVDSEVTEVLNRLIRDIKNNIQQLKVTSDRLTRLQNNFFTELKVVGDLVGIPLPEPSEIDALSDNNFGPLSIIKAYQKAKNIHSCGGARRILESISFFCYSSLHQEVKKGVEEIQQALQNPEANTHNSFRNFFDMPFNLPDELRTVYEVAKRYGESNPRPHPVLDAAFGYVKTSYVQLLSLALGGENFPHQLAYLMSMAYGCNLDISPRTLDCYREDLDVFDLDRRLGLIPEHLRQPLFLDFLLLTCLDGKPSEEAIALAGEMTSLLMLDQDDVRVIVKLAGYVLQDSYGLIDCIDTTKEYRCLGYVIPEDDLDMRRLSESIFYITEIADRIGANYEPATFWHGGHVSPSNMACDLGFDLVRALLRDDIEPFTMHAVKPDGTYVKEGEVICRIESTLPATDKIIKEHTAQNSGILEYTGYMSSDESEYHHEVYIHSPFDPR